MLNRNFPSFPTLPQPPPRGPMPPIMSVVIPLARTNLITNPSFETNTTGWSGAFFGSIARSSARQYHGVYSLAVTPTAATTDGANYDIALTSGTTYAISCKLLGVMGVPYRIALYTTGGTILVSSKTYIGTGRWQWLNLIHTATSSATHSIIIGKASGTSTAVFYIDGAQCEAISDGILQPTTYIDGDQPGVLVGQQPPAYGWNGTPHASTSYRTAVTRAGGYLVNLSLYNFLLTGIVGLGMAAPNNVSVPYTLLDGARYLRTQKPPRTFSLAGRWQADDIFSLRTAQSDMRQILDRDYSAVQQPLVLMVEPQDECGNVIGDFAQIQCLYAGGLEGNDGNIPIEDTAPAFTMYLPFLVGGDGGAVPGVQQTVANANAILKRDSTGNWVAMGTGGNGLVRAITVGLDGRVYAAGGFTSMGGVANTSRIAYWDGSAWNAMGTGANDTVWALAVGPNGDIYAGGEFTSMDGVANTARIARWNGSAWFALGTGVTTGGSAVKAIAVSAINEVYVTGSFTAPATRIARWDGAAWNALGTGLNDQGQALIFDKSSNLYVGGVFTTANGVSANYVAKWNGTTFVALAGGLDANVFALALDSAGNLYVGGIFSNVGYAKIAKWNGTSWTGLGAGLNSSVYALVTGQHGIIYAGGAFSSSGSVTFPDRFAAWNGSTFIPMDVDLPGTATITALYQAIDGALYVGFDQTGSAIAAANTVITNNSPSIVYPKLIIRGPSSGTSRIYQIVNYTTGTGIWFNYTINAGETATFIFDPANPSYLSNFVGDLTPYILPGSQPSLFYFAPGNNTISFFAAAASVSAVVSWQIHCNGIADLVN